MKIKTLSVTAALFAGVGLILGTAPTAWAAGSGGTHHLMVKTSNAIHSIYITTQDSFGTPLTFCRAVSAGSGWKDGHQDLWNSTPLTVTSFSSTNCTTGYSVRRSLTVPGSDGLDDLYVDLT